MSKKQVRIMGSVIFCILALCTLISVNIYDSLLPKVRVTVGEELSEKEIAFPIECYQEKTGSFFCITKRAGDFREEYVIEEKEVSVKRIEDTQIIIAGDIFYMTDFSRPLVVVETSEPLQDGDVVLLEE